MKKTVFLKSTLRQVGRSLFLLLLVGVISFAFASRIGGSQLISQEMDELTRYYRSIGHLDRTGPDEYGYNWGSIPDEVIEYLKQSPYVDYIDHRNYISGVMQDDLYNVDLNAPYAYYSSYAAEVSPADFFFYGIYTEGIGGGRYRFTVDTVLSGYPEYPTPGESFFLCVDREAFGDGYTQLEAGGRYLLRACCQPYGLRMYKDFTWKPLAADLPWFLSAESGIDLSLPEYAQFVSEMKQCHDNANSLMITATADMTTVPFFQPTYVDPYIYNYHCFLTDGRLLNHEDHLNGNRVMVIYKGLADARGLSVGDTLTLRLREIAYLAGNGSYYQNILGYQTDLRPIGQEEAENDRTETFEIVGIYDELSRGTDQDQYPVYIPLSVVPEDFTLAACDDRPEMCSLVLNSPEDEEAFRDATQQALADMGYYITFTETNYQSFKDSADGVGASARNNVIIFAVILAVCFCLAVFVYFRFRRKDIAVSRALGVPAGACIIGSILPLMLVGGVGIVAGSALAWVYTQGNAESLLATLVEAASAESATATLSMSALVILVVILIAALLALALIFAAVTVKKPVLSQLQGGRNKR